MKKDIQIIPTVMPDDYEDLVEKIEFVRNAVSFVNIDVMDGKFVTSKSWPYSDKSHFENMMQQEEGLPYWQDLDFSVDLMISNPQEEVPKWIEVGVSEVIIHIETLDQVQGDKGGVEFIKKLKEDGLVKVVLSLSPDTPNEELNKYEGFYDAVQFMGIHKVGYQGTPFAEEVLTKISDFRNQYPDIPITIDGGVSEETMKDLYKAGATRFASGSYIFESNNAKEAIESLKSLVN